MLDDLKYFRRTFARNCPSYTLVLISLSLGLGLTITMFSIIDGLVLHPIPHSDIERVVHFGGLANPPDGHAISWWSQVHSLEDMATYSSGSVFLSNSNPGDSDETVPAAVVSSSFFSALGVSPLRGRSFRLEDYGDSRQQVVIIGAGFWRNVLGSAASVIGTEIRINAIPHTIIGVLPEGFAFPGNAKLWLPRDLYEKGPVDLLPSGSLLPRGAESGWLARLKPGLTTDVARSELLVRLAQLHALYTPRTGVRFGDDIGIRPLRELLVKNVRLILSALLAGAICVLLIALSNSITILLGLAAGRRRELGIRMSLGASAARMIRQLITEALVLGAISGLGGLCVAWGTVNVAIKTLLPAFGLVLIQPALNPLVCGFSILVSLVVGLCAGLPTVLQLFRQSPLDSLREQQVRLSGPTGIIMRRGLICVQTALALLLTIGAGLALRTLMNLSAVKTGFEPQRVLFARVPQVRGPNAETRFPAQVRALLSSLHDSAAVDTAAVASLLPLVTDERGQVFIRNADRYLGCVISAVTADYFQTLQVPMLAGHSFNDFGKHTAIVNITMARRIGLPANPVGSEIRLDGESTAREIVGMVDDVRDTVLEQSPEPHIYLPFFDGYRGQSVYSSIFLTVRCSQSCAAAVQPVRARIREITGRSLDVEALENEFKSAANPARLRVLILGMYAILGFILAVVGVYGLVTHIARTRRYEVGVRMALGARPRDIVMLMLKQSLTWAGAGLIAGIMLATAFTRLIEGFLFGVSPVDAITFAAAALVLTLSVFVAAILPARKAANASPRETLQRS